MPDHRAVLDLRVTWDPAERPVVLEIPELRVRWVRWDRADQLDFLDRLDRLDQQDQLELSETREPPESPAPLDQTARLDSLVQAARADHPVNKDLRVKLDLSGSKAPLARPARRDLQEAPGQLDRRGRQDRLGRAALADHSDRADSLDLWVRLDSRDRRERRVN